jgi:PQQ-dependent dehydrogenase (s-GDH family)
MTKKITSSKKISFRSSIIVLLFTSISSFSQVLEVKGNNTVIANNHNTPSPGDFTDFGNVPSGNKFSRSFILKNTGSTSLIFTASPVVISGDATAARFTITTSVIVTSRTLTANTYTIIEISYNPDTALTAGPSTATVTLNSNNLADNSFTFSIKGTPAAAVSPNFTRTTLSSSFNYPYTLIYGPDDYLWLTERVGKKVNRVHKTSGVADELLNISSLVYLSGGQDGLMGMALHPNLGKGTGEDYVYIAYTYSTVNGKIGWTYPTPGTDPVKLAANAVDDATRRTKIVRYTYSITSNNGTLTSPLVLMEGLLGSNDHNSGKLTFGPDTKLYYTIGDLGVNQFANKCNVNRSQDIPTLAMLNSVPPNYEYYQGKTLRLNLDGSIPDDNPVINGIRSHIFTYGHRNAQGLVFGKNGKLYSSEHGPKSDDELNILQSGGNYGWPYVSGYKDNKNYEFCNWSTAPTCTALDFNDYTCGVGATSLTEMSWAGTFTNPITTLYTIDSGYNFTGGWLTWPTVGPSSAKIYEGFTSEIPGWDNSIFITALKKGRVYRQKLSADGTTVVGDPEELFYTQNRYRDIAFDPDGKTIYIITDSGGTTSGPSGSSSLTVTDLGKILVYTYNPATLTCTAPVPDVTTLPTITNSCSVASITPPTATNNCAGIVGIVGLTDTVFPITAEGTTTVIWKYNYGNGLTVTQNQTVTINSTTWDGNTWSNGLPSSQAAIFAADYTISSDLSTCSLTVSNNANVTVNSNVNVTLNGPLTVSSGSFTLNTNANLIQTTNVNNSGNIIVKRDSSPLMRLDYTLWSSPVANQNLSNFSPLTTTTRFYTYNTNTNFYNTVATPPTTNFTDGQGYLIRMPNTHPATPAVWNGSFTGVPHNGYYPITMTNGGATKRFNLVGNPYPSPINMTQFVTDNNTKITGTLYFWRKTNGAGTGYCTWAGGTFVTNSNAQTVNPNGVIQTGQGFFVEALNASTSLQFNNGQRVSNTTGQFFKMKQPIADRSTIWLNTSNAQGDFSQMAVGYILDATQGVDTFDGKYFNDSEFALNTLLDNEEYVIQGRPLPFDVADVVPLVFKTITAGNYTIAIDHVEGLFSAKQDIILVDHLTGIETDLKSGGYTFAATAGVDNSRFSLKYQKTLGNHQQVLDENNVLVYKSKGAIHIKSGTTNIDNVKLFDISGRFLFEKKNIKSQETSIENSKFGNQILVVKITLKDQKVVNKKIEN